MPGKSSIPALVDRVGPLEAVEEDRLVFEDDLDLVVVGNAAEYSDPLTEKERHW